MDTKGKWRMSVLGVPMPALPPDAIPIDRKANRGRLNSCEFVSMRGFTCIVPDQTC
jgi:hypothetical protein